MTVAKENSWSKMTQICDSNWTTFWTMWKNKQQKDWWLLNIQGKRREWRDIEWELWRCWAYFIIHHNGGYVALVSSILMQMYNYFRMLYQYWKYGIGLEILTNAPQWCRMWITGDMGSGGSLNLTLKDEQTSPTEHDDSVLTINDL